MTTGQMMEINSGEYINYIIIACEEDIHLVTDVLRAELGVFNTGFVMSAVARCEMAYGLSRYQTTVGDRSVAEFSKVVHFCCSNHLHIICLQYFLSMLIQDKYPIIRQVILN